MSTSPMPYSDDRERLRELAGEAHEVTMSDTYLDVIETIRDDEDERKKFAKDPAAYLAGVGITLSSELSVTYAESSPHVVCIQMGWDSHTYTKCFTLL